MRETKRKIRSVIVLLVISLGSWFLFIHPGFSSTNSVTLPRSSREGNSLFSKTWDKSINFLDMWGDETHLYTIGQYSSLENKIRLQKWDKEGNQIWNKSSIYPGIDYLYLKRMWGNNDSIFLCGYQSQKFVINDTVNYDIDSFIEKWYKNGTLHWNRAWNLTQTNMFIDIWGDNSSIFVSGYMMISNTTEAVTLTKWNLDGENLWNASVELEASNFNRIHLQGDLECLYVVTDTKIMKWSKQGSHIWNYTTYFNSLSDIWVNDDGIYIISDKIVGSFTFTATKHWIHTSKIDLDGNSIWNRITYPSVYYAEGSGKPYSQLWSSGNILYSCEDYVADTEPLSYSTGLLITKLDEEGTVLWNSEWSLRNTKMNIFDLHLWGDSNYVYAFGHLDISSSYPSFMQNYFVKWEIGPFEPNIPLIVGLSLSGALVVIATSWIIAKPIRRIKRRNINTVLKQVKQKMGEADYTNQEQLDSCLPSIENFGTVHQKEHWHLLNKKNDINYMIQTRLHEQMALVEAGDFQHSYDSTSKLLHDANITENAEYIDHQLVSDITDLLKKVAERMER